MNSAASILYWVPLIALDYHAPELLLLSRYGPNSRFLID